MAAGLPTEGANAERRRAGDVARRDTPTCALDERLGEVQERVCADGWDACVVVNEEHVVLGLLRAKELDADPGRRIEEVMRPGPSTFRPHGGIVEMAASMVEHELETPPITSSDGRLIGILRRDDAVQAAQLEQERHADG